MWKLVEILAAELCKKFPVPYDELVADGLEGAARAARKFEPERGWQFQTYARHRIRGQMLDGVRKHDYLSRTERRRVSAEIREADDAGELYADKRTAIPLSLDSGLGGELADLSFADLLVDQSKPFDDHLADLQVLGRAYRALEPRLRDVLGWIYLDDMSAVDIAQRLDVSQSRVSQLHTEALHEVRVLFLRMECDTSRMTAQVLEYGRRKRKANRDPLVNLLDFWAGEE